MEGRDPNPLFDSGWYLQQNVDVAESGINPLAHYLSSGAAEGRDPNPLFDGDWYLKQNPDVATTGANPLAHYLSSGAAEGRDPNPLFDSGWYLQQNVDVAESGINPLAHYLSSGAVEGRDPNPLFDSGWYLQQNVDVAESGINPLAHYLSSGAVEGRDPNPLFDGDWYLKQNPDVADSGINPLAHYLRSGSAEGRNPNPYFDGLWYLKHNPYVKQSGLNPLYHYLTYGWIEGRNPSKNFITDYYLENNIDVKSGNLNPLVHYILHGRSEGRLTCNQFFPSSAIEYELYKDLRENVFNKVAIFACYNNDASIPDHVVYYLRMLRKVVDSIILVSDNPIQIKQIDKIYDLVAYAKFERHMEYDFGSYKIGIEWLKENHKWDGVNELILCNDSCYGPISNLKDTLEKMKKRNLDFWGITINHQFERHIQSYFIHLNKRVIHHHGFDKFFERIQAERSVREVVLKYEVKFSNYFESFGFKFGSLMPESGELDKDDHPDHNYTVYPLTLLKKFGCPFIKTKAIKKRSTNHENYLSLLSEIAILNRELFYCVLKDVINDRKVINDCSAPLNKNVSFSIIMPTHNRQYCISRAIDSLLAQPHHNYELIIVDDGSTDNTKDLLSEKYGKQLHLGKIRYFRTNKSGVSCARNYGLRQAKNDWIGYLDTDNVLMPCFFDVFVKEISAQKEVDVFYGSAINSSNYKVVGRDVTYKMLTFSNFIDMGALVHRRSLVEYFTFDENLKRLVDWEFFIRLFKDRKTMNTKQAVLLYNSDEAANDRISNNESFDDALQYIQHKHAECNYSVTTIILSYNHEKYIQQAIQSVMSQKGNFINKIIISDDGSFDITPCIINKFREKYPEKISDLSSPDNLGFSKNLKKCLEESDSEYIAICEGDDYWSDNFKLQKQIEFLTAHPACSMVFSAIKVLNESNGKLRQLNRQKNLRKNLLTGADFLSHKSMNLIANYSACVFKKSILMELPDYAFSVRLNEIAMAFYCERFGEIGYLEQPMSVYRQHAGGLWTGKNKIDQLKSGLIGRKLAYKLASHQYRPLIKKRIEMDYEVPLKKIIS
ncbi:MAG: glycosyltransferase [Candidatus Competibacteraceae bacterium]|nr:glycosyltransferase [Candidatus Competibacteraceae bacterium]